MTAEAGIFSEHFHDTFYIHILFLVRKTKLNCSKFFSQTLNVEYQQVL